MRLSRRGLLLGALSSAVPAAVPRAARACTCSGNSPSLEIVLAHAPLLALVTVAAVGPREASADVFATVQVLRTARGVRVDELLEVESGDRSSCGKWMGSVGEQAVLIGYSPLARGANGRGVVGLLYCRDDWLTVKDGRVAMPSPSGEWRIPVDEFFARFGGKRE